MNSRPYHHRFTAVLSTVMVVLCASRIPLAAAATEWMERTGSGSDVFIYSAELVRDEDHLSFQEFIAYNSNESILTKEKAYARMPAKFFSMTHTGSGLFDCESSKMWRRFFVRGPPT